MLGALLPVPRPLLSRHEDIENTASCIALQKHSILLLSEAFRQQKDLKDLIARNDMR